MRFTNLFMPSACAGLVAAALASAPMCAAGADLPPAGLWRTIDDASGQPRSLVRIAWVQGRVQGTIEASLNPADPPDARCDKCPGPRKGMPILGMTILTGLRPAATDATGWSTWDGGEILDPDSGTVYSARLRLNPAGTELHLRGFVGMALFGRTQVWQRVE